MLRADMVGEIVARRDAARAATDRARARGGSQDGQALAAGGGWQPRQFGRGPMRSIRMSGLLSGAARRWDGTGWCCSGSWRRWGSAAATSRCSATSSRCATGGAGRNWRRSDSRPSRASRPRWISASSSVDWRAARNSTSVCVYPGVFAPPVYLCLSQRAAGGAAGRP